MTYNKKYPLKHLSVRVAWHDRAWDGSVCNNPKANSSCLILKGCAEKRDDQKEQELTGKLFHELAEADIPPCKSERSFFMSSHSLDRIISHPYSLMSPATHGNLKPTPVSFPAYSLGAVPYAWMLKKDDEDTSIQKAAIYGLDFDLRREPKLTWNDVWVQEKSNQQALLTCFFEHFEENQSLVFIYAKQVPFVETSGRVLVGVGRIKRIIPSGEYEGSDSTFASLYWENMVLHSIRPDSKDGFLLPYHKALDYQKKHPDFDPADIAVIVPADKTLEFSFVSEHVGNDTAIRMLRACLHSFQKSKELGIVEDITAQESWIHNELARIEKLRGAYPGLSSALRAFGFEKGHFLAAEIINGLKGPNACPWEVLEKALVNPAMYLSESTASCAHESIRDTYQTLKRTKSQRLKFLHLLSRFDLSYDQAKILYISSERDSAGITHNEKDYLQNPYLIYEDLIGTIDPVAFDTIDLGMFVEHEGELQPDGICCNDPFDSRRIRSLTVLQLESAAITGHTLLPHNHIIMNLRKLNIKPTCQITEDLFARAETYFVGKIGIVDLESDLKACQLDRYMETRRIINTKVEKRISANRLEIDANWRDLIDQKFGLILDDEQSESETKARQEKAAALEEMARSRFSVLIGPAGTGKTSLLSILAEHPDISSKGILLLAPTGKARVRLETLARKSRGTAMTLAQFLSRYKRFNPVLQEYKMSGEFCDEGYETVILDESSMLTEEMLATTMDCLRRASRFILAGDHRQLPPIGAGRPFIDIVNRLVPTDHSSMFPRVYRGYNELTIRRRQGVSDREDMRLAEWFGGGAIDVSADSILNLVKSSSNSPYLRIEHWGNDKEFEEIFDRVLLEELDLKSADDVSGFNRTLGSKDGMYFNWDDDPAMIESWQILSPVRERPFGVRAINRKVHLQFRKDIIARAKDHRVRLVKPVGVEQIVYGDKIINLVNKSFSKHNVFPQDKANNYLANGDIGIIVGQWVGKNSSFKGALKLEAVFSSHPYYKYSYHTGQFSEDRDNPLELAYALTVHKAQGSEFSKTIIVIPDPCFLLSRELLYTALTRQKDKVILLIQGETFDIRTHASDLKSESLARVTNLFYNPNMVEHKGKYLEKNLIHQASDETLLRSKSELLIYQQLINHKIEVSYERLLVIDNETKLPDFTIEDPDTGKKYFWEHCGMAHDSEYMKRWVVKKAWYEANGILEVEKGGGPNGTLIVTYDKPVRTSDNLTVGAISCKEIDEIITRVLL